MKKQKQLTAEQLDRLAGLIEGTPSDGNKAWNGWPLTEQDDDESDADEGGE